jgi:hypothetical protein
MSKRLSQFAHLLNKVNQERATSERPGIRYTLTLIMLGYLALFFVSSPHCRFC